MEDAASMHSRNPDQDFVLHGKKSTVTERDDDYLSNSQKTLTSKNFSNICNHGGTSESTKTILKTAKTSKKRNISPIPKIDDLERSINELKMDLQDLNKSLEENYGKSKIFLTRNKEHVQEEPTEESSDEEDLELKYLMQRNDSHAITNLPCSEHKWFSDPKHLTKELGDFPTMHSHGVSKRSVSPLGRSVGRFGSEIATKNMGDMNTSLEIANNDKTFPVRLTAPHIVGVSSLLPPKYPVRNQDRERAKSPDTRCRSVEPEILRRVTSKLSKRSYSSVHDNMHEPLPAWMPTSKHANASSQQPPPIKRNKRRGVRTWQASIPSYKKTSFGSDRLSRSLPLHKPSATFSREPYQRPSVRPLPGNAELSFLRSIDQIDTRRAMIENSPYQQELSRLRLERLRVEEEYLLQLKRESELERIRGPKPKWYELKGPTFHYECNKNTSLHNNADHLKETLQYRNHLLEASREFTLNMKRPVPALE